MFLFETERLLNAWLDYGLNYSIGVSSYDLNEFFFVNYSFHIQISCRSKTLHKIKILVKYSNLSLFGYYNCIKFISILI